MAKDVIIPYTLPPQRPKSYSDSALRILRQIENKFYNVLPVFLRADVVLTLSGVRAYDTYIDDLGKLLTKKRLSELIGLLSSYGLHLEPEISEYKMFKQLGTTYYLINEKALKNIPKNYKIKEWVDPNPPYTYDRFLLWSYVVETRLHQSMVNENLPGLWSNSYWAPIDIRVGMLLGYPGQAIVSYVEAGAIPDNLLSSDIAYFGSYDAAYVGYEFSRELEHNPSITRHQKLWSEILIAVYESPWHKNLKQEEKFKKLVKRMKLDLDEF